MFNATELEDVNGVMVHILDYPPAPMRGIQYLDKEAIEELARKARELHKEACFALNYCGESKCK